MRKSFLLLISLAIIACSPVRKYQSLPEVQAWENDIQKFEQLDKSEKYPDDAILFMGSSSIRLWSTLEADMAPYPVIQRGFGGSRLSDFVVYTNRIVTPHRCRAIVIFIANDITGSDQDNFVVYTNRIVTPHRCRAIVIFIANDITGSDQDKTPQEVAGLFRNVLRTIRITHPDTPVFWIAITPTELRWKVWPEIKEAGSLIEKICNNRKNTYYIHTDFAFFNENGKPISELFRDDKLHLNEKGYVVWTGIITKELNRVLNK